MPRKQKARKPFGKGKPGSGSRFQKCVQTMSKKPGVYDPEGLCAAIGRRAYGSKKMAAMARAGMRRGNPLGGPVTPEFYSLLRSLGGIEIPGPNAYEQAQVHIGETGIGDTIIWAYRGGKFPVLVVTDEQLVKARLKEAGDRMARRPFGLRNPVSPFENNAAREISTLRVGESKILTTPHGDLRVARVNKNSYHLNNIIDEPYGKLHEKHRWGTETEILDDISRWFDTGQLPGGRIGNPDSAADIAYAKHHGVEAGTATIVSGGVVAESFTYHKNLQRGEYSASITASDIQGPYQVMVSGGELEPEHQEFMTSEAAELYAHHRLDELEPVEETAIHFGPAVLSPLGEIENPASDFPKAQRMWDLEYIARHERPLTDKEKKELEGIYDKLKVRVFNRISTERERNPGLVEPVIAGAVAGTVGSAVSRKLENPALDRLKRMLAQSGAPGSIVKYEADNRGPWPSGYMRVSDTAKEYLGKNEKAAAERLRMSLTAMGYRANPNQAVAAYAKGTVARRAVLRRLNKIGIVPGVYGDKATDRLGSQIWVPVDRVTEARRVIAGLKNVTMANPQGTKRSGVPKALRRSSATGARQRKNPDPYPDSETEAADFFETFHGRPATEIVTVPEDEHYHEYLGGIGELVEIKLLTKSGYRVDLDFSGDNVMLASAENGQQLYLTGGNQTVDLASLHMQGPKWRKDLMNLGQVKELTYRTDKSFDRHRTTDYFHKLSEESRGPMPDLLYDTLNDRLKLAGGVYRIPLPPIGTSPGIVD